MNSDYSSLRLIYFTGIDGSGKTTIAKNLVKHLASNNLKVRYFYARHFPILIIPFKLIANSLLLRKTNEFKDYAEYSKKKKQRSKKMRLLSRIYGSIWFFDYLLITYLRMIGHLIAKNSLIVDRYYFDIIINISITLDMTDSEFQKIINIGSKLFPKPSVTFFLDLPEDVAYQRKDDIQSVEYLKERREKYLFLCNEMRWITLDATKSQEAIQQDIINFLNKENV